MLATEDPDRLDREARRMSRFSPFPCVTLQVGPVSGLHSIGTVRGGRMSITGRGQVGTHRGSRRVRPAALTPLVLVGAALRLGVHKYLEKPVAAKDLLALIREILDSI